MRKILMVFFCLVALSACESPAPKDTDGLRNIIPTDEPDRAPKNPKDVSQVQNALPKLEPRTAAGNKSPYKVMGVVYRVMDDPTGYEAYGRASWYGEKFHGNRTSNGEVYDMYEMTAAHKTLPIPSYVRVTNVENGKVIIVRVNDRGPFAPGRIIDLSYAGAKKLDFLKAGTAHVKVEYINPLTFKYENLEPPPGGTDVPRKNAPAQVAEKKKSNHTPKPKLVKPNAVKPKTAKAQIAPVPQPSPVPVESAGMPAKKLEQAKVPSNQNAADSSKSIANQHSSAHATKTNATPRKNGSPKISSDWRAPQRYLQVGAFRDKAIAEETKKRVQAHTTWPLFVEKGKHVDGYDIYRVHIGPLPDENNLSKLKQELMRKGMDEPLRVIR